MSDAPVVIVTRPEREAAAWSEGLQALGIRTESMPLIQINALHNSAALREIWTQVPSHLAVMFVSANAVRFFMAERPEGLDVKACRAWSTGPGTQAALLACGWPADRIDSPAPEAQQFDSEALWALVSAQVTAAAMAATTPPASVLVVRGADADGQMAGRDWLTLQLTGAGVQVLQTVAYGRQPSVLSAHQKTRVQRSLTDGSWWLFSSSEAAIYLQQSCPDLNLGQARALATHPRIAQKLLAAGWGRVETVPAGLKAQAESIKSLA
jgi:uroporphyrinogen-III synthase